MKNFLLVIVISILVSTLIYASDPLGEDDHWFGEEDPQTPEQQAQAINNDPESINTMGPDERKAILNNEEVMNKLSPQTRMKIFNNPENVRAMEGKMRAKYMSEIAFSHGAKALKGTLKKGGEVIKAFIEAFKHGGKVTPDNEEVLTEAFQEEFGYEGADFSEVSEIQFDENGNGKATLNNGEPFAFKCPKTGSCGELTFENGKLEHKPEQGNPVIIGGGGSELDIGNGYQHVTGPNVHIETTLPPDRNLLTGKLTMEGSSNITLGRDKKTFDKVRDGQIETEDINGRYKTSLKDAEDITIYSNGTYTIGHAEVLELHTDKNGKKDRIIVVNGNDISFDGNELKVGSSDSIIINERTIAVNPEDFYGYISYNGYPGYPIIPKELSGDFLDFRFNSSDAVIIGDRTYPTMLSPIDSEMGFGRCPQAHDFLSSI
jgi:hypothetical protein